MKRKALAAVAATVALVGGGSVLLSPDAKADTPGSQPPADAVGVVTYERGDVERSSGFGAGPQTVSGATDILVQDGIFHPVAPCRVYDTRFTTSPPANRIDNTAEVRTVNVISSNFTSQGGVATTCGISSVATAVHLNLGVTGQTTSNNAFATIWPAGIPLPVTSSLNYNGPNKAIANALTVKLCRSATGGLCANDLQMTGSQPTHMFVDVLGYYEPALTAQVNGDGTVHATSLALTSVSKLGTGSYQVIFNRDVTKCIANVSRSAGTFTGFHGSIYAEPRSGNANGIFISTASTAGASQDSPFSVTLDC